MFSRVSIRDVKLVHIFVHQVIDAVFARVYHLSQTLTFHKSYHNFQDWSENIRLLLAHISFVHKYARYVSKIKVSHAFTTAFI